MINNPLEIESDFKYWFLGYFLGDGSMYPSSRGVAIYSTDFQVIDLLGQAFSSKIFSIRKVNVDGRKPCYTFYVSDSNTRDILDSYKFTTNKSKIGWYGWELIPDQFRPAFLRGLYEADGTYHIQANRSVWGLRWYGHFSYMQSITEYLHARCYSWHGSLCAEICNRLTREFIRKMYPSSIGLGTLGYPSNIRKALKAFEVLEACKSGREAECEAANY